MSPEGAPADGASREGARAGGAAGAGRGCSVMVLAAGAAAGAPAGTASPGARIHAIVVPTGTTAPAWELTPPSTPSADASISTTALSVSTSRRISPLRMASPSLFFHDT